MRHLFKVSVVLLSLAYLLGGNLLIAAETPDKITLTWSEYAGPGDDRYVQYNHFIKRISEETNGRVVIKMYPGEQLVKSKQVYEACIRGTVDMTAISPAYFAGKLPLLLYQLETGYWEVGDSAVIVSRLRKEIDDYLGKDGIKYLGWGGVLPPLCLVGPKKFQTFDDMKGLKFRSPGIAAKVINAWGGTGVPISNPEIYMALQRKVVDGAYATLAAWVTYHMWEVAPAITLNRCGGAPTIALMNKKKWESLPDDVKQAFQKVSKEMPPWVYFYSRNFIDRTEKFLKSKFKESYKLTPEEHEVWMSKMRGYIWKSTVKKHGEPAQTFWDKWLGIAKECAKARETGDLPRFY